EEKRTMAHDNHENQPTAMMLINDCSRMFGHRMRKFGDESGVPGGYRSLLMQLAFARQRGEEGITQYELAKHTHLSPPTVSVTLQKMEREGYITRVPDETDMRQMRVTLTEKGIAVDRANRQKAQEIEALAFEDISPEERQELSRLLLHIRNNLSRGIHLSRETKPNGKE
ncbi:MAG: MarR family winged helix-turn-helix transcriptional regulator, partial [Eubacteriales bacterium]